MWLGSDHFNTLVVSFVFVFVINAVTNCIEFFFSFYGDKKHGSECKKCQFGPACAI